MNHLVEVEMPEHMQVQDTNHPELEVAFRIRAWHSAYEHGLLQLYIIKKHTIPKSTCNLIRHKNGVSERRANSGMLDARFRERKYSAAKNTKSSDPLAGKVPVAHTGSGLIYRIPVDR